MWLHAAVVSECVCPGHSLPFFSSLCCIRSQYGHFKKYGVSRVEDTAELEYGRQRYRAELQRLLTVLDIQLASQASRVGDDDDIFVASDGDISIVST